MRTNRLALVCVLFLGGASTCFTPPAHAKGTGLDAPVKLGEATLRVLGKTVYSATLHTQGTPQFTWSQPLSLRLDYAYGFTAEKLITASRSEIRRIEGQRADQDALIRKLAPCFRDVRPGDTYVAYSTRPDQMRLLLNGTQTCEVRHADVRKRFLSIWLSPKSRSARLSRQLRGE